MNQADVLSEEFRTCIIQCIHTSRAHSKIKELGLTVEEMVNDVIARTWVCFISLKTTNYAFGTIAQNQLNWTIQQHRLKPIPVIAKDSHYTEIKRVDNIDEVNLLLKHASLSIYERKTLEARFLQRQTLQTVPSELSLTGERVRQIQLKGLKKLQKLTESI
jgi:DNA-directed RNA polymerase sigma subunit (sigma70/sigma32)